MVRDQRRTSRSWMSCMDGMGMDTSYARADGLID